MAGYCTLSDVKAYPTQPITDATSDAAITSAINAVRNFIDGYCRWSFDRETRTAEERFGNDVKIDNEGHLLIRVDKTPIASVASVEYRFRPDSSWTAVTSTLIDFYPSPSSTPRATPDGNLITCYTNLSGYRSQKVRA